MSDKRTRELIQRNRLLVRQEALAERDLAKLITALGDELTRRIIPGANEPLLNIVDELQPDIAEALRRRSLQTALLFGERTQGRIVPLIGGEEPGKSYYGGNIVDGPVRGRDFVGLEVKGFWEAFQETITQWVDLHALARAVTVTHTMRESIRQVLMQGQEEGWGEAILARAIQRVAGDLSRTNAARIARTEMHTASTVGSDEAARATGLRLIKEWASAEDGRTRLAHAIADGQEVPGDEAFTVGGVRLMFPGDPNGTPANRLPGQIINCRCQALHHPVIGGKIIR